MAWKREYKKTCKVVDVAVLSVRQKRGNCTAESSHALKRKDTVSREQLDDPVNIRLEKVAIGTAKANRPRHL